MSAKPCPLPLLRRPAAELDQTVLSGRRVSANCANRSPKGGGGAAEGEVLRRSAPKFEIKGDESIRKPTGARFSADEGRREISHINWGTAGNVQPNGDDYRPHEIREIAAQLLKEPLRS